MEVQQAFGLAHLWQQSDLVIKAVAFALVAMSVATWYLILAGLLRQRRADRAASTEAPFWRAPDCTRGLAELERATPDGALLALVREGVAAQAHVEVHADRLRGGAAQAESLVSSALHKARLLVALRLESGQTTLASIGSSAPFVGLFGTVWGIYRALIGISASGVATLDTVAGPVGEALIMTAFGLFVAIPAVLAFNGFGRANRVELARLDAAAHDLHVWLATGARVAAAPPPRAATTRDAGARGSLAAVPAGTATPAGSE